MDISIHFVLCRVLFVARAFCTLKNFEENADTQFVRAWAG